LKQIHKILLYAPGNDTALQIMRGILKQLDLKESTSNVDYNGWKLLPMISKDLQATNLGTLLEHALDTARQFTTGGVVFLGMDSPVLPLDDIVAGLLLSPNNKQALLCPADDGGYGMLCVPPHAESSKIFSRIQWSHSLTAVSQIKALTDQNIMVGIGTLMHDIDEPEDVQRLCLRLSESNKEDTTPQNRNATVLDLCSGGHQPIYASTHPCCYYTRKALMESGQLLG
jgi:glycosyltransferase A (GT-A) superfamily protein (DUF2064 family)